MNPDEFNFIKDVVDKLPTGINVEIVRISDDSELPYLRIIYGKNNLRVDLSMINDLRSIVGLDPRIEMVEIIKAELRYTDVETI